MSLHGGSPWAAYQGFTTDKSVNKSILADGTIKRVLTYATEFRGYIGTYLTILIVDSLLVVAQPLLFKRIVDVAIPNKDSRMVTIMALAIAATALMGAALGLLSRRMQSTIGEGLIFNMRTQVFDHVQEQSIAFFTRAQTGALISRLNSDVMGAQRAFTSTLGGVVGNTVLDIEGVKTLATLPSLDELRGKLLGLLNAPATRIAGVVQAPAGQIARVIQAFADKDAA
jgi:ATP-binding cassette subfamily B protein